MVKLKLIQTAFAVLLILLQRQNCLVTGYAAESIDTLSAVIGLGEFVLDKVSTDPDEADVLEALRIQYTNINAYFEKIINDIKHVPGLTNFVDMKQDLAHHFGAIDSIYNEAIDTKNHIAKGKFFADIEYNSRNRIEPLLKEHFNAVYILMLNNLWSPFKINEFITEVQTYENSCVTGTSNLQLLDRIFGNLRLSTIKYLTAKLIMHDSLFIYKDNKYIAKYKENIQYDRENVLDYVNRKYRNAAAQLKAAMARASTAVWGCDPVKSIKKGYSSYTAIPTLSNFEELDLEEIWNKTRCPPDVCDNLLKTFLREDKFYVNNFPIRADKYHVIIGAKFEYKENILCLSIKQGKLLSNGSIDTKTISWKAENGYFKTYETELDDKQESSGVRGFDLTEVKIPDDHVLTGLQLKKGQHNRVHLSVEYSKIDFRKGKFIGSPLTLDAPQGTSQINLEDKKNPMFATNNKVDSNNDQFVHLTDNYYNDDLTKRTAYPYIDLQKLAPNVLLSGIGLVHQGQEGYGGFLSLKLHTFNITSYVVEDTEIRETPKFLNELKIENFRKQNHFRS